MKLKMRTWDSLTGTSKGHGTCDRQCPWVSCFFYMKVYVSVRGWSSNRTASFIPFQYSLLLEKTNLSCLEYLKVILRNRTELLIYIKFTKLHVFLKNSFIYCINSTNSVYPECVSSLGKPCSCVCNLENVYSKSW